MTMQPTPPKYYEISAQLSGSRTAAYWGRGAADARSRAWRECNRHRDMPVTFRDYLAASTIKRVETPQNPAYTGLNQAHDTAFKADDRVMLIHEGISSGKCGYVLPPIHSNLPKLMVLLEDGHEIIISHTHVKLMDCETLPVKLQGASA